jgi:hypothetical protein
MRPRGTARIDTGPLAGVLAGVLAAVLSTTAAMAAGGSSSPNSNPYATSAGGGSAPHPDSLALMAARGAGAGEFHRVGALHYTFKAQFEGKTVERRWTWHPHEDSVAYRGKDAGGLEVQAAWSRRNRFSMESPQVQALDKWFVNDQYWLLFPLHLVWDKGLRLESATGSGEGEAWRLTAVYPKEGGYTPGDAYDIFLDGRGSIKRWIFRKGNAPEPTREALWAPPVQVGPLRLSMERKGPDGKFRIRFEEVRVDMRGETVNPDAAGGSRP